MLVEALRSQERQVQPVVNFGLGGEGKEAEQFALSWVNRRRATQYCRQATPPELPGELRRFDIKLER
jgi:hypothetical protein